jgi:hypothetical protein
MSNPFFLGESHLIRLSMQTPDRIGAIVLAFTLFAAYWGWADLLYFLGVISLPLGALGSESLLLLLVDVVIVNLYAFRQRRRARTSQRQ